MLDFRKSASRGFEPTRDFGVPFTGFRQWWLPLRQRRGCGLRGAVRGELETDVGFLVGFSTKFDREMHRKFDARVWQSGEKHAKINDFATNVEHRKFDAQVWQSGKKPAKIEDFATKVDHRKFDAQVLPSPCTFSPPAALR